MPSMMLVWQYLRGNAGKAKVHSTPETPEGENVTIGGRGAGKRKLHDRDLVTTSTDAGSVEYGMTDLSGNVKSTEGLVEPGMAK